MPSKSIFTGFVSVRELTLIAGPGHNGKQLQGRDRICLETESSKISSCLKSKGKESLWQKYLRVSSIFLGASLSPLIFKSFILKGPLMPPSRLFSQSSIVKWSKSARSSFLILSPPTLHIGNPTSSQRFAVSHFNLPCFLIGTSGVDTLGGRTQGRIKQGWMTKSRHFIIGLLISEYFLTLIMLLFSNNFVTAVTQKINIQIIRTPYTSKC